MKEVHDNPLSVHLGRDRLVYELERRVHQWPQIRSDVAEGMTMPWAKRGRRRNYGRAIMARSRFKNRWARFHTG